MSRPERLRRVGGLAVSVVAAAPFVYLWAAMTGSGDDPLSLRARLELAIWIAVFATPWMLAARLLWRAWWRRAGARLSSLDGPGRLLVAAAATLPTDRRDWGAAMTAELTQAEGATARWRFAAGCARAAVFPPGGNRAAVAVAGTLTVAALAATTLVTGAALPAGRVFALTFVGLLGGLATLTVARSPRLRRAGPGAAVAGLALAGVAGCLALTAWYVAEYPSTYRGYPRAMTATLPPATAVVLAAVLAGGLWLALRPPRWLLGDRRARRFGVAMALVIVAGFVLACELALRGVGLGAGAMAYLLFYPPVILLAGSAAAAAAGRRLHTGVVACAWATVLSAPLVIVAWLAEAPRWYRQLGGMLLDSDGGIGMGTNLGDAIWWTLPLLALWALPLGILGAAAGRRLRRRGPIPTA
ncbi:MAG TPA: hypothetical protein VHM23_11100 [Actinomycetota bacterium]|jgi:hypothetical protein|nr:hypothetical protein [Actinomycetota bacterium]